MKVSAGTNRRDPSGAAGKALGEQAVAQAQAGADITGPAAMIPGIVRAVRPFKASPARPGGAVEAGLGFVGEGAGMLLLEPTVFCADVLITLRAACGVPLAPFSVSGEYARFAPADGHDWRLMTELFLMLKRSGASQIVTYAPADVAASLG